MKHRLILVLTLILLTAGAFQATAESDSGFQLFPVASDSYRTELSVAPKIGILGPATSTLDVAPVYGGELALNCLLFDLPGGPVRTALNYNYYQESSTSLSTIELSPVYFYQITDSFSAGIGPGVGYMMFNPDSGAGANLWAVQAISGLRYTQGLFYAGLEGRYQWHVTDADALDGERLDNYLLALKVGISL